MSVRKRIIPHDCRSHILVQHGPSGGKPRFTCSVCRKPVVLRFRQNEVLARV